MKKKEVLLDNAYQLAVETVRECLTPYGLYASGGIDGYKGVWSRDSFITFLGASLVEEERKKFKNTFKQSLLTLGKYQSKNGQIPNAVLEFQKKKPQVDYLSIDSNLWFIIGHYIYKKRYHDKTLFNKHKNKIKDAFIWLRYRDLNEKGILEQLPTTDWQDAFPDKYGHTINTQALYYAVLKMSLKPFEAIKLKKNINKNNDLKLWNGNYYWAYRWKNHNKYKEIGDWFDSLGNILAIIFDLTSKKQSQKILDFIKKKKIHRPYPVKSIYPPIKRDSKYWNDYYLDAGATPNNYLNGGIWPYIGGFYVCALIKLKKFKEAKKELEILAESNLKGQPFPEWIDPIDKKTHGKMQAWSAGTFLLAYHSLKNKKVLI